MNWFLIALLPPFFWATTNFVDQYLTRTYFSEKPFTSICFSTISYYILLLGIYMYQPVVLNIPTLDMALMSVIGAIFYAGLAPYILAIQKEDASIALPLFQAVPFFTLILGWVILGERIGGFDMIAGAIIIGGAMGMLWDFSSKKFSYPVFGLMMLSSGIVALHMVLVRAMAVDDMHWLTVTFWILFGRMMAGTCYFLYSKSSRQHIKNVIIESRGHALLIDFIQNIGSFGAAAFLVMAMAAAPNSTYVMLVNGLQPFFLLVFGIILGSLFPAAFKKHLADRYLLLRFCFLILIFTGLGILVLA